MKSKLIGTLALLSLMLFSCQVGTEISTMQNEEVSTLQAGEENSLMSVNSNMGTKATDYVRIGKDDSITSGTSRALTASQPEMHYNWPDGSGEVTDSISSLHVPAGYEVIVYRYVDYKGEYRVFGPNSSTGSYYVLNKFSMTSDKDWSNKISSLEIRTKVNVPSKLSWIKDNPSDSEFGDVNVNEVQGVANDGNSWYICNMTRIYKCEKDNITNVIGSTATGDLPSTLRSYDHWGDLDFKNGNLYAPLYKQDSNNRAVIVKYTRLLNYVGFAYFPSGVSSVSYVTVNPNTNLFYVADGPKKLKVYKGSFSATGGSLTYCFTVDLDFGSLGHSDGSWWNDVWRQGGEFGDDNMFYYVLDHKSDEDSKFTGIYMFKIDGPKASAKRFANIQYDPDTWYPFVGAKRRSELEGITYWDLGSHSSYPGQVHALFLSLEADEDDAWLMHYKTK
ncbi:MAG: hypothetical protein JXR70_15920 [Spirochaetales bacterium]|nr:hypothetical protein [Spirochaetales bacterium]